MVQLDNLVDKNYTMMRVNKAMANAMNKNPADLVGEKCALFFCGEENNPPDHCPHKKLLADGKQHSVEISNIRAKRPTPGLKPQHLEAVRIIEKIVE